jgi:hypothetical protein
MPGGTVCLAVIVTRAGFDRYARLRAPSGCSTEMRSGCVMTRPPWAVSTCAAPRQAGIQKLTNPVSYCQATLSGGNSKGYLRGNESMHALTKPPSQSRRCSAMTLTTPGSLPATFFKAGGARFPRIDVVMRRLQISISPHTIYRVRCRCDRIAPCGAPGKNHRVEPWTLETAQHHQLQ